MLWPACFTGTHDKGNIETASWQECLTFQHATFTHSVKTHECYLNFMKVFGRVEIKWIQEILCSSLMFLLAYICMYMNVWHFRMRASLIQWRRRNAASILRKALHICRSSEYSNFIFFICLSVHMCIYMNIWQSSAENN